MQANLMESGPSWEIIPSADLEDVGRDRLYAFREALEIAKDSGFQLVSETIFEVENPGSKPINKIAVSNVEKQMLYGGNTFYISPEYSWLAEEHIDGFSVLRTAKAETSAHGVFFGVLQNKTTEKGLPVAIKPCAKKPSKAYIDWANNSLIARTKRRHFSPVGFLIHGDINYSITELEPGVETLDNTDWTSVLQDTTDSSYDGQRRLLSSVGKTLAELHTDNIYHGDTQFKNIAVDITGNTYFIDWEAASIYAPDSPEVNKMKKMSHDLKVLLRSVAFSEDDMGVGLLTSFSPSLQWEHFKSYIFDSYMETFLETNTDEAAFSRIAEVEEDLKKYILSGDLALSVKRVRNGLREPAATSV